METSNTTTDGFKKLFRDLWVGIDIFQHTDDDHHVCVCVLSLKFYNINAI